MNTQLERYGFHKRSGVAVDSVLYCLTMWIWLKSNSIGLFARDSLRTFCAAGKDVLYEAMNREDWSVDEDIQSDEKEVALHRYWDANIGRDRIGGGERQDDAAVKTLAHKEGRSQSALE